MVSRELRRPADRWIEAKADLDEVELPAAALQIASGAPSRAVRSFWHVWLLDPASVEGVGSAVRVPGDWATVDLEVWWVDAGTGTGDVVLRGLTRSQGIGATLTSPTGGPVTATAAGQDVIMATVLATNLAVSGANLLNVHVDRQAADAADTLVQRHRRPRRASQEAVMMIPSQLVYDPVTDQLVVRAPAAEVEGDVDLLRLDVKQLSADDKRRLRAVRDLKQTQPAPGTTPVTRR